MTKKHAKLPSMQWVNGNMLGNKYCHCNEGPLCFETAGWVANSVDSDLMQVLQCLCWFLSVWITDSSPARWSDTTHEVNWEIDAKIVSHIADSVNPVFCGESRRPYKFDSNKWGPQKQAGLFNS